jgi:flagellar FliL protein
MLLIVVGAIVTDRRRRRRGALCFGHGPDRRSCRGQGRGPNIPKLVPKEGVEGATRMPRRRASMAGEEASPDPTKYQATFYPIEQSFTSNLRDSDGFVQLGIGVSTFYDNRVIENLKKNDMPVRSAVLMTLADQDAFVITTPEGKKLLQRALKDAINDVLKSREGFGGVDSVYFTSFIIQ